MNPQSGRLPATRGVFAIEEQQQLVLPDPIALDTSLVVEALLATQPLHGVCDAFLTRIFDSGVSVVTSELLRAELAETAFAIAMKERWDGKWRAHRTDGRTRPRAGRLLNNTLARYDEMLGSLPHISVRLGQVADSAPQIMTKYGLASYDAIHATRTRSSTPRTCSTPSTPRVSSPAKTR